MTCKQTAGSWPGLCGIFGETCWLYWTWIFERLPSRSLTAKAPENLPKPNRKGSSSNPHFSGAMLNFGGVNMRISEVLLVILHSNIFMLKSPDLHFMHAMEFSWNIRPEKWLVGSHQTQTNIRVWKAWGLVVFLKWFFKGFQKMLEKSWKTTWKNNQPSGLLKTCWREILKATLDKNRCFVGTLKLPTWNSPGRIPLPQLSSETWCCTTVLGQGSWWKGWLVGFTTVSPRVGALKDMYTWSFS